MMHLRPFHVTFVAALIAVTPLFGQAEEPAAHAVSSPAVINSDALFDSLRSEFAPAGKVHIVNGSAPADAESRVTTAFPDGVGFSIVEASDQPFKKAFRFEVAKKPNNASQISLRAPVLEPLLKGDHVLVTYYAKGVKRPQAVDDGNGPMVRPYLRGGLSDKDYSEANQLTPYYGFTTELSPEWKRYWFKTTTPLKKDYPAGEARAEFMLGIKTQDIEIGGVAVMAFREGADVTKLPKREFTYVGREPDAPWRKEAEARIDRYRKNDLTFIVKDAEGKPVSGATVHVAMKRHAFPFGTAVAAPIDRLIGTRLGKPEDVPRYKEILTRYFNSAVTENGLKWAAFTDNRDFPLDETIADLKWLKSLGYHTRGHVLVWPNIYPHTPKAYRDLPKTPEGVEQLRQIVRQHVTDLVTKTRGLIDDWDVTNETEGNRNYMDLFGREEMLEWYRLARAADPDVKLTFTEPKLGQGGMEGGSYPIGKDAEGYSGWLEYLIKNNAPVDTLGAQAHFGRATPKNNASPEEFWAFFDAYAKRFGKPMQFTEVDINIDDDRDPDQLAFQADRLRDVFTIGFAHPSIIGITQWGFWEGCHWFPKAALWRKDWSIKPIGQAYIDLIYKTWWTDVSGKTNAEGTYSLRGFKGDYEITVTVNGQTFTSKVKIGDEPGRVALTLPDKAK